jgi:hypothetical protein
MNMLHVWTYARMYICMYACTCIVCMCMCVYVYGLCKDEVLLLSHNKSTCMNTTHIHNVVRPLKWRNPLKCMHEYVHAYTNRHTQTHNVVRPLKWSNPLKCMKGSRKDGLLLLSHNKNTRMNTYMHTHIHTMWSGL